MRSASPIPRAAMAGAGYAALVFAAGAALGTVRVLLLVPAVGEFAATAIELPAMLAISWLACGWALRMARVAREVAARAAMGATAFAVLIAAELGLALLTGSSVAAAARGWGTAAGALGLAGQLAFAAMPLLALRRRRG